MTGEWVENDPVVVHNVNKSVKWHKGLDGQGKSSGRFRTIDGHWRGAELLHRYLEGEDNYQLQRRLDAEGDGTVMCKQWLPVGDNGKHDWKYFVTTNLELIAECAIEPAKREQARQQLEKGGK